MNTLVEDIVHSLGFKDCYASNKPILTYFRWPPDVFALAATLLKESGAYIQASRPHPYDANIPLHSRYALSKWQPFATAVATKWRSQDNKSCNPPAEIVSLLNDLSPIMKCDLRELSLPTPDNFLWLPLVQLMCLADEACRGIGILFPAAEQASGYPHDSILCMQAMEMLQVQLENNRNTDSQNTFSPMTLCSTLVSTARAIVLPKMRVSQRGITIRSFSHNLALVSGTDIEPIWNPTRHCLHISPLRDSPTGIKSADPMRDRDSAGPYNIILVPWPEMIAPLQFKPLKHSLNCLAGRPPELDRFFAYTPAKLPPEFTDNIKMLVSKAVALVGPIHAVVFPELSMTQSDFNKFFQDGGPLNPARLNISFVVAGVCEPPLSDDSLGTNCAAIVRNVENPTTATRNDPIQMQEKHHRWALDQSQVSTYSLGTCLGPGNTWWEGMNVRRRQIRFFGIDAFTAFTVLICEDLARPDPVGDVVRAIGPNLVICLLMDGPQLVSRWSARYATVLADDPGSSVITLSSLGMVKLSRLREKPHETSNVVALWRESGGAPVELRLPEGKNALLLSITADRQKEYTIDGRSDDGMASVLHLAGVHPIDWSTSQPKSS